MAACGYHFEAKPISRSDGRSAVAAASYRTGEKLRDERLGQTCDYTRKQGIVFVYHAAPKNAPDWAHDLGTAWNAVERAETKKNATLALDYICAFPHQLDRQQREYILKDFVREQFTRKGFMATAAIHEPDKNGDQRNHHAHIMFSYRPLDENGFSKNKDRRFSEYASRKETLAHLKERWAELSARQLERAGFQLEAERWRHGHKTNPEQSALALARGDRDYAERCDGEATRKLGEAATHLERQGIRTERGDQNRAIEARNAERAALKREAEGISLELEREKRREDQRQRREEEDAAREKIRAARLGATLYTRGGMAAMQRDALRDIKEREHVKEQAERRRKELEKDQERQRREQEAQRADLEKYLTDPDYRRKLWQRDITERDSKREQQRGQTRGRDDGGGGRKRER